MYLIGRVVNEGLGRYQSNIISLRYPVLGIYLSHAATNALRPKTRIKKVDILSSVIFQPQ